MVKKNPALKSKVGTASPFVSFVSNILVFGIVLFIFGLFVKEDGFQADFINLLILGECLNAFEFLIIDMLWWRNSKRVRFTDTNVSEKSLTKFNIVIEIFLGRIRVAKGGRGR